MRDGLTSASVTTAWVIVGNKPLYPVYVWWLAGADWKPSLWTLAAWPLFAALPFFAGIARVGLALVGTLDTALATVIFGEGCGVEAFFAPCAALAALSFRTSEAWTARVLTAAVFVVFAALRYAAPAGLFPLSPTLLNLNLLSAASLTAFIGLRFASAR